MWRRFFQILAVLAPLGLFAWGLQPVQRLMYGGHATQGIVLLVAALAVLALLEGLLFRYWILPGWSEKVAERLYAGSYLPEDDALAQLIDRIAQEKDASLLPQLETMVQQQAWRMRGWLELARLQHELKQDTRLALATLENACRAIHDPEDVALLMYRAARLCEKSLQDADAARKLLNRLVELHPATVYGRKAAALLEK